MASLWTLHLHAASLPRHDSMNFLEFRTELRIGYNRKRSPNETLRRKFVVRALSDPSSSNVDDEQKREAEPIILFPHKPNVARTKSQNPVIKFHHPIASLPPPPLISLNKKHLTIGFAAGLCAAATLLIIVLRSYLARKSRYNHPGSVADLVRRGQLRSDRRGMYDSKPETMTFPCACVCGAMYAERCRAHL